MNPKLKIETAKVADLVPYAGNAKEHPEWQVRQIANSIEQFGNCDPIAIWHNADGQPEIVEGHGRLLALKMLGIEMCPTIALDHLDDDARRAYAHVHNQLTMNTEFDMDLLNAQLEEIQGFDWESLGFDFPEIPQFEHAEVEEDDVPEEVETRTKRGDIWILGAHRLMCGDSTDAKDVERLMGGV